ncbi:peptidase (plasmid) [Rhodococcus sp. WB1]|uniref:cation:proton antiporter domain-containing protein n=1 Tax=Rhodococcus sp. WB1 TaxID=1033922 RepID=UPI00081AAF97|nr:cation:proton antiporter [Rhodococcus sp. WB1]ANZ28590.1 peptidase [Rhodococcus sp. WB1]
MIFALTFGLALLLAVLLSALSERSPLSTSLIFLVAGLVAGPLALDAEHLSAPVIREIASIALFAVLFADGQQAPIHVLRRQWVGPTRALVIGMPLTFALVAVLAHLLLGLDWVTSMLLGAILAPTDPVFAAALVGRDDVTPRLRSLLNIESGLNDGLALPVVVLLIVALGGIAPGESAEVGPLLLEVGLGGVLGVVLPLVAAALVRLPFFGVEPRVQPLGPLAVAVLLFVACETAGANLYLAAFTAGITFASVSPTASAAFAPVGEFVGELSKNGALLAFGALVSPVLLAEVGIAGWIFAVLVLVVGRPVPVMISLLGTRTLNFRERLAAAWFGPKGFASVVYGLLVLESDVPEETHVLALVVATVIVSITLHSTTDVPVAAALRQRAGDAPAAAGRGSTVTADP